MNNFKVFVLFVLTITFFILFVNAKVKWITDSNKIERLFVKKVINRKEKPSTLCDISKERKLGICSAILKYNITNKYSNPVYFSQIASFFMTPNCVKNILTFNNKIEYNKKEVKQDMFPCYGRHNPMRTSFKIDDNFDYIYLSGGPKKHSIFIYHHLKMASYDQYILTHMIKNLNIEELPKITLKLPDTTDEQISLRTPTYNKNQIQIEINYVREVLSSKDEQKDPLDLVCLLEKTQKMQLCKEVVRMAYPYYEIPDEIPETNKRLFNEDSTKCEKRLLHFVGEDASKFNNQGIRENMFPCYGSHNLQVWYLSTGFREFSVTLYIPHHEDTSEEYFQFSIFFENMKFHVQKSFYVGETSTVKEISGETSNEIEDISEDETSLLTRELRKAMKQSREWGMNILGTADNTIVLATIEEEEISISETKETASEEDKLSGRGKRNESNESLEREISDLTLEKIVRMKQMVEQETHAFDKGQSGGKKEIDDEEIRVAFRGTDTKTKETASKEYKLSGGGKRNESNESLEKETSDATSETIVKIKQMRKQEIHAFDEMQSRGKKEIDKEEIRVAVRETDTETKETLKEEINTSVNDEMKESNVESVSKGTRSGEGGPTEPKMSVLIGRKSGEIEDIATADTKVGDMNVKEKEISEENITLAIQISAEIKESMDEEIRPADKAPISEVEEIAVDKNEHQIGGTSNESRETMEEEANASVGVIGTEKKGIITSRSEGSYLYQGDEFWDAEGTQ